jgi:DNA polymerase delta subunit 2
VIHTLRTILPFAQPRYELPEAGPSKRAQADYATLPLLNQPFLLNDALTRTYKAQYSNIYFQRLLQLRAIVAEAAKRRWDHVQGKCREAVD